MPGAVPKRKISLEPPQSPFIQIALLYSTHTLLTLTEESLKVWDCKEIFSRDSQDLKFKVKPGYLGVDKSPLRNHQETKKKILSRGTNESLFYSKSQLGHYVLGVSSRSGTTTHIRLFYLSKYTMKIKETKKYEQVPTKLVRQFQEMSRINKHRDLPCS